MVVSLIGLTLVIACGGKQPVSSAIDGATIYKTRCILCHGSDGKLGLNGAKDISASILSVEQRVELIKTGKNTMTPFEGILTPEEMQAVANYSMTLK